MQNQKIARFPTNLPSCSLNQDELPPQISWKSIHNLLQNSWSQKDWYTRQNPKQSANLLARRSNLKITRFTILSLLVKLQHYFTIILTQKFFLVFQRQILMEYTPEHTDVPVVGRKTVLVLCILQQQEHLQLHATLCYLMSPITVNVDKTMGHKFIIVHCFHCFNAIL